MDDNHHLITKPSMCEMQSLATTHGVRLNITYTRAAPCARPSKLTIELTQPESYSH